MAHLESLESDDARPRFAYIAPLAPHFPSPAAPRHNKREVPDFEGNPGRVHNDPNIDWFEAKLAAARTCEGTRGDNPCP